MQLETSISHSDVESRLALSGRLDFASTIKFHKAFQDMLREARSSRLVVDCGGLGFVDSSGLGALVVVHDSTAKTGQTLSLANCSAELLKVLKLVNLHKLFKLV